MKKKNVFRDFFSWLGSVLKKYGKVIFVTWLGLILTILGIIFIAAGVSAPIGGILLPAGIGLIIYLLTSK